MDDIVQEAKRLVEHGFHEIVLTGVMHLGIMVSNYQVAYISRCGKALLEIPNLYRIRFGSIESGRGF